MKQLKLIILGALSFCLSTTEGSARTKEVDWEQEYHRSDLWEKAPHRYSIAASQEVPEGVVLDIGCGEGYDCVYFAKQGYDVTGIDSALSALQKTQERAEKEGVILKTLCKDINHLSLDRNYDIITSFGTFQFLGSQFFSFIKMLQERTNPGGVHALYVFANDGDFYHLAKHRFAFPSEKEIRQLYVDWEFLSFESKRVELLIKGDNGEKLFNLMYKILVKKNSFPPISILNAKVFVMPPSDFIPKMEVAGCFMSANDRLLFLKRQPHKSAGGLFGIPGGKLEKGETPEEGIRREVWEETSLFVKDLKYWGKVYVRNLDGDFIYHMFESHLEEEKISIKVHDEEHSDFIWVSWEEALHLPLVPGGKECLELLIHGSP